MTDKPRAPATLLIHSLMDTLWDLQDRMTHTGDSKEGMNVLEAHDYFSRESDQGRECSYALKARSLFAKQDYTEIKKLFLAALDAYRACEGDDFGTP